VARRQLLTEEERRLLFGIPHDPDALTRHYSFTRSDRELLTGRRGNANQLGFAVQLALLRHPGMGLAQMEEPVDALVAWLAERLKVQAAAFTSTLAGRKP
jgi:TnpA family transposase